MNSINDKMGKLFLFYGAIIFFSLLFIESLKENLPSFLKLVGLIGIVIYTMILVVHLISICYPNSPISKKLKNKDLDDIELVIIILFGVIPFFSFLKIALI